MNVVGVDVSSHAIAVALLDENHDHATNVVLELHGKTAFDRLRQVPEVMPQPGWYEHHGVYLAAVEMPKSKFYPSLAAQLPVYGAVITSLPAHLPVWSVKPTDWKTPLAMHGSMKPVAATYAGFELAGNWTGDALDALGVALYARDLNAAAVAKKLKETA